MSRKTHARSHKISALTERNRLAVLLPARAGKSARRFAVTLLAGVAACALAPMAADAAPSHDTLVINEATNTVTLNGTAISGATVSNDSGVTTVTVPGALTLGDN